MMLSFSKGGQPSNGSYSVLVFKSDNFALWQSPFLSHFVISLQALS